MDGAAKFKVSPTTKPRNNAIKIAFVCFNKTPPYFAKLLSTLIVPKNYLF